MQRKNVEISGEGMIAAHLIARQCVLPVRGVLVAHINGISGKDDPFVNYVDGKGRPGLLHVDTIRRGGGTITELAD